LKGGKGRWFSIIWVWRWIELEAKAVMVVSMDEIDDEEPRNHHRLGCMMVVSVQNQN